MKALLVRSITFYQWALSPLFHNFVGTTQACRFVPSCSEYTKQQIESKGVVLGILKGLRRLLNCQPFYSL